MEIFLRSKVRINTEQIDIYHYHLTVVEEADGRIIVERDSSMIPTRIETVDDPVHYGRTS